MGMQALKQCVAASVPAYRLACRSSVGMNAESAQLAFIRTLERAALYAVPKAVPWADNCMPTMDPQEDAVSPPTHIVHLTPVCYCGCVAYVTLKRKTCIGCDLVLVHTVCSRMTGCEHDVHESSKIVLSTTFLLYLAACCVHERQGKRCPRRPE